MVLDPTGPALGNAVFQDPAVPSSPLRSTHPANRSCSRTFSIRAASGLPANTRKSAPTVSRPMPYTSASSQAPTMAVGSAPGSTRTRVHTGAEALGPFSTRRSPGRTTRACATSTIRPRRIPPNGTAAVRPGRRRPGRYRSPRPPAPPRSAVRARAATARRPAPPHPGHRRPGVLRTLPEQQGSRHWPAHCCSQHLGRQAAGRQGSKVS